MVGQAGCFLQPYHIEIGSFLNTTTGLSSENLSNFRTEQITITNELALLFEAASALTSTVFYVGNFNADLLAPDKSPKEGRKLLDLLDVYDLHC